MLSHGVDTSDELGRGVGESEAACLRILHVPGQNERFACRNRRIRRGIQAAVLPSSITYVHVFRVAANMGIEIEFSERQSSGPDELDSCAFVLAMLIELELKGVAKERVVSCLLSSVCSFAACFQERGCALG